MNIEKTNRLLIENLINKDVHLNETELDVYLKYKQLINTSPILLNEQKIYKNIKKSYIEDTSLAMRYLDENIKLFEIYSLDEFDDAHNQLNNIVNNSTLFESKNQLNQSDLLYDNIITIIRESLTDYDKKDVNQLFEAQTNIINHIKQKKIEENSTTNNEKLNEIIIEIAVNKFNEKYSNLNENDIILVKTLSEDDYDSKMKLYESYKSNAITLLNESMSDDISDNTKEWVNKSICKLKTQKPDKLTINEDIIKIYDLINEIRS